VIFSWKDARGIRQERVSLARELSVKGTFVFARTTPPLNANIKLNAFRPSGGQILPFRIFAQGQVIRVRPAGGSLWVGFAVAGGWIVSRKWTKGRSVTMPIPQTERVALHYRKGEDARIADGNTSAGEA
jgi:hypothetical protein